MTFLRKAFMLVRKIIHYLGLSIADFVLGTFDLLIWLLLEYDATT